MCTICDPFDLLLYLHPELRMLVFYINYKIILSTVYRFFRDSVYKGYCTKNEGWANQYPVLLEQA